MCEGLGASASKVLGSLVEEALSRHACGQAFAAAAISADRPILIESLKQARVAAYMAIALVKNLDADLYNQAVDSIRADAERFAADARSTTSPTPSPRPVINGRGARP